LKAADEAMSENLSQPEDSAEFVLRQEAEIQRLKLQLHQEYPTLSTSSIEEAIVRATESTPNAGELVERIRRILDQGHPAERA
jgi:hypothetical protein